MRLLRNKRLRVDPRRAGWYGGLGFFVLALVFQSMLTWIEAGHIAASRIAACSLTVATTPTDADSRSDSPLPARGAPHDPKTCLQCQFFRDASGAEAVAVVDSDASALLLPECVPMPFFRAAEAPRYARPEPRAPPRIQAFAPTVSA